MSILTDLVVTSATAAFAHFGVTLDTPDRAPPQAERTVSRSQPAQPRPAPLKSADCPDKGAKTAKPVASLA